MARPKKTVRSISKNISIPEDLCARMELELFSEVDGKIPFGSQHEFFTMLLRDYFRNQDAAKSH